MLIRVTRIKEKKNGKTLIEFEYKKEFANLLKKYYNKKRITKKMIRRFVREGLMNYIKYYREDIKDLEMGIK